MFNLMSFEEFTTSSGYDSSKSLVEKVNDYNEYITKTIKTFLHNIKVAAVISSRNANPASRRRDCINLYSLCFKVCLCLIGISYNNEDTAIQLLDRLREYDSNIYSRHGSLHKCVTDVIDADDESQSHVNKPIFVKRVYTQCERLTMSVRDNVISNNNLRLNNYDK